jgi:hypothetical protein
MILVFFDIFDGLVVAFVPRRLDPGGMMASAFSYFLFGTCFTLLMCLGFMWEYDLIT